MQSRQGTTSSASERIVITGFGLLTPIGQSFWQPGRVVQPRLTLPYTVSGPENFQCQEKHSYVGVQRKMQQGSYSFKIEDFELLERAITEEAKNEHLT
ncbi:MAG TPA: hypothetical protein VIK21_10730 [Desulfuromonadaceae bacterium]